MNSYILSIEKFSRLASDGTPFNDIAILCRTKSQTNVVIKSLQSAGIPVIENKLGLLIAPQFKTSSHGVN